MLFRRFEQLIDIFRDAPSATPPNRVLPFYFHYIKQVWPSFVAPVSYTHLTLPTKA